MAGGLAGSDEGGGVAGGALLLPPRILNITVPHVGHLPLMAFLPFFIVSSTASTISFLALHLTQYPSGIENYCWSGASCSGAVTGNTLLGADHNRQHGKGFLQPIRS